MRNFLTCCLFIVACKSGDKKLPATDSPYEGTIKISVDESFRPVIESQLAMYHATYPNTNFIATYKTEADCWRDIFKDSSVRLAIVTKGLSESDEKYFKDSLSYSPGWQQVATDAIAIIVNNKSMDTLFTLERLREQLSGKVKRDQKMVFDGLNATSTVRFIKDSILKGKDFDTSVVKAAKNTAAVIDFISNNENAIGFIGLSWIGNPEDTAQRKLLTKVKIARVACEICEGKPFVMPMQASITTLRYPLIRGLFYINKENFQGLGSGFSSFLKNERGQLIFRRSYLNPVMDFQIRRIKLNTN